jgi:hypothetical protein
MPAKSQQQQKLMGLALSVKKGDTPASKVSKAVKDMVKNMSKKELEKYAGTKHKGLPKKVDEAISQQAYQLDRMIGGAGQQTVQNFIDDHNIDITKLLGNIRQMSDSEKLNIKYIMTGKLDGPAKDRFIKTYRKETSLEEAKATLCGRCGHVHVKGTPCPRPFKENQEMDPVDSITMDIPLFLRMLEFAREDASEDMDLHDVTERANMLTKDRGMLSMEDYNEIVKAAEQIKEGMGDQLEEPYFIQVVLYDAPKALDIFNDSYRNSNIKMYGSDVYASDSLENIEDLYQDFRYGNIHMIDYNLGEEELYEASSKKFSKEYDEDPTLKGNQKGLPDALQKAIIAKANKKLKETAVTVDYSDPAKQDDVLNVGTPTQATNAVNAFKASPGFKGSVKVDGVKKIQKETLSEGREFDYEGSMARTQLYSIIKNAKALFDQMDERTQLQGWVQSKLTKAEDYIDAVRTYLEGESLTSTTPLMVSEQSIKDEEGASLNIGDVVKAADGGIYQIIYSYGENKPFLVPFDLKKRKPINLRSRTYFDSDSMITKKLHRVMSYSATKGGFIK